MPPDIPLTRPVPEPTVATEVLLLLQVPPVAASVSNVVAPAHTFKVPAIGELPTFITAVAGAPQPVE